jgi:hypothetical protein
MIAMKYHLRNFMTNLLVVYPHEVQVYDFLAPPPVGVVTTVT